MNLPPFSARDFSTSTDGDKKTLVCEVSTLLGPLRERRPLESEISVVFEDERMFEYRYYKTDRDGGGDATGWHFFAVDGSAPARFVLIIND